MEKITKRMALSAILSSLNEVATAEGVEFVLASVPGKPTKEGQPTTLDVSVADAIAYCENELTLLASKAGSIKKPTATQQANMGLREDIRLWFVNHPDERITASQVCEKVETCIGLSTQKVSPQLSALVKDEILVREVDKRVIYYKLA